MLAALVYACDHRRSRAPPHILLTTALLRQRPASARQGNVSWLSEKVIKQVYDIAAAATAAARSPAQIPPVYNTYALERQPTAGSARRAVERVAHTSD